MTIPDRVLAWLIAASFTIFLLLTFTELSNFVFPIRNAEVIKENYYGSHGNVLAVNTVNIDSVKSGVETVKYSLLKVGGDKIYGRFEATGVETRTNEPNKRYFVQTTVMEINGEDVAAKATLLIYLSKEDWDLFRN